MKERSSFDRRVKDRRDADRVGRRYERVASYQNSGGETVCAAGNNGKAKKNVRHAIGKSDGIHSIY